MTADSTPAGRQRELAAERRSELDRVTTTPWPTLADASPERSAVAGVLRERRPPLDVPTPRTPWTAGAIEELAGEAGVTAAQLLAAVLVDAGSARIARGRVGGDVRALVARLPSLTAHDRETTLELLDRRDDCGG